MVTSKQSLVEDLHDKFLQCAICMEAYKSPRMLPCIHSFCLQCLEQFHEKCGNQLLYCPTCRREVVIPPNGLKDLPSNFLLVSLMDRLNLEAETPVAVSTRCNFCKGNQRIQRCIDCCLYICQSCRKVHDGMPGCGDHILIPTEKLHDEEYTKSVLAMRTPRCTEHGKEKLRFYCTTCSKLVCGDCAVVSHQGHKCFEADKKVDALKKDLESALRKSSEQVQSVSEIGTSVRSSRKEIDGYANEAERQINECYEILSERLLSDKKKLMEEVQKIKIEQIGHCKELHDSLTNWQELMGNTREVTKKILEENNKWDILAMGKDISDAFKKLGDDETTMKEKHSIVQKGKLDRIEITKRKISVSPSTLRGKEDLPKENILGMINETPNLLKPEQKKQAEATKYIHRPIHRDDLDDYFHQYEEEQTYDDLDDYVDQYEVEQTYDDYDEYYNDEQYGEDQIYDFDDGY